MLHIQASFRTRHPIRHLFSLYTATSGFHPPQASPLLLPQGTDHSPGWERQQDAAAGPGRDHSPEDLSDGPGCIQWMTELPGEWVSFLFWRSGSEAEICRGDLIAACGA